VARFVKGDVVVVPFPVRPNRLFTADTHVILYRVGQLAPSKVDEVIERVVEILRRG